MSQPRLSKTHQQQMLDLIREQRCEIRSLRRELEAVQPWLLWMAARIHYLETEREGAASC